jgi:hypothetical protein
MSSSPQITNRTWTSPIAAVAFVALSVSGIMMLFHVKMQAIKDLHEAIGNLHKWMGFVFAVVGIIHLILNWRLLLSHLNKKVGMAAAMLTLIVCIAFMVFHGAPKQRPGGSHAGEGPGRGEPQTEMEHH